MTRRILTVTICTLLAGCGSIDPEEPGNISEPTAQDDTFYRYEWHLHVPDASFAARFGISDAANIGAESAWEESRGAGVVIAILDDYFDADHPDIAANVIATYNAQNGGSDVSLPSDDIGHGQLCAGAAAAPENAQGVIGVAPEAKLILVGSSFETDADIIRAFEYAKAQGADIISCSWGSYNVSQAVADEIEQIHAAGITVIFAAGNDNLSLDQTGYNDEAELPWVIGVSASSEYNDRTSYSNYGSNIDLLAPGGENIGIVTTDATGSAGYSPSYSYLSEWYLGNDYAFFYGTSASAPVAAGACALLKSKYPELSPDDVREILIESAEKIGSDPYDADGFETRHAYGKIDLAQAFELARQK